MSMQGERLFLQTCSQGAEVKLVSMLCASALLQHWNHNLILKSTNLSVSSCAGTWLGQNLSDGGERSPVSSGTIQLGKFEESPVSQSLLPILDFDFVRLALNIALFSHLR